LLSCGTLRVPRVRYLLIKKLPAKAERFSLAGAEGLVCPLAVPEIACALERRAISTAALRRAPSPCHRQRSRVSPGTLRVPRVRFGSAKAKETALAVSFALCFTNGITHP
jgi:hypothetical protein